MDGYLEMRNEISGLRERTCKTVRKSSIRGKGDREDKLLSGSARQWR